MSPDLFSNFGRPSSLLGKVRGQAPNLWFLSFLSSKNFEVEADDLVTISELGRGAYGVVEKVRHAQSGTIMAVKVSRGPPSQGGRRRHGG